MKVGITFGTFDMFLYGNLPILQRPRARSDRLVVGVASDEVSMRKDKHRKPVFPWGHRVAIVDAFKCIEDGFKEVARKRMSTTSAPDRSLRRQNFSI